MKIQTLYSNCNNTGRHASLKHDLPRRIEDGECSSKKRKEEASTGDGFLDLNVPPPPSPHSLYKG